MVWDIYPGLPNAMSVQQETDVSYGTFKNVICNNLKRITSACFDAGTTMKLGQSTFRLIFNGRSCPLSGIACHITINEAFSLMSNLKSWCQVVLLALCIIIIASLFSYANIYWDGTALLQK